MADSASTHGHDEITMQAAEWLLRVQDRELSNKCIAAWQEWLNQDPRHVSAFDQLQSLQECISAAPSAAWPTEQEVAADEYDGSVSVADWNRLSVGRSSRGGTPRHRALRQRRSKRWYGLAAAVALVAVMVSAGYQYLSAPASIQTAIGELRRVQLEDGSAITLGGRSRIGVKFTTEQRSITFSRGEAFFDVAKDRERPFVVHAGNAVIKAVGTAFDVRQAESRITVAVAEGVVEVTPPPATDELERTAGRQAPPESRVLRLSAGQRLRIDTAHAEPEAVPTTFIGAWRDGRRQYLAEPLAEVIADLQRDSGRRIVLTDPEVGRIRITGTVLDRNIDTWLRNLETALAVQVQEQEDGSVRISSRK